MRQIIHGTVVSPVKALDAAWFCKLGCVSSRRIALNAIARKLLILLTLSSLAVAATPSSRWDDEEEEEVEAICSEFLAQLGGHAELVRVLQGKNPRTLEKLWASKPMRAYLEKNAPGLLDADPWDHPLVFLAYLDQGQPFRQSTKLVSARNACLRGAISQRGHSKTNPRSPRKGLELQSHDNLRRLVGAVSPAAEGPMAEAVAIVERFAPVFTHNAPRAVQVPSTPILSSKQLEALGFSGGLNTAGFNRWLNADDNVFFFVHLTRTDASGKQTRAHSRRNMALAYGGGEVVLSTEFAKKNGWISAYVMDPDDLIEFGDVRAEELALPLREALPRRFQTSPSKRRPVEEALENAGIPLDRAWEELTRYPELATGFTALRERLGALDFTVSDFTLLLRRQLLLSLLDILNRKGEVELGRQLRILSEGNPAQLGEALQRLFYEPLKLPRDFELKVPVLVPPTALTPG